MISVLQTSILSLVLFLALFSARTASLSLQKDELGDMIFKNVPIIQTNVSVHWDGAEGCSGCPFGGIYSDSFACSSSTWEWDSGNWDNGTKMFEDPIIELLPQHYVVTQVTVNVWGLFDCRTTEFTETKLSLFLQGTKIIDWSWPLQDLRLCRCANCQEKITFSSPQMIEWPNFNYGGLNELRAEVEHNVVCISTVELLITYSKRPDTALIRPPIQPGEKTELLNNVAVLSSIAGGVAFLICASLIVLAVVRRFRNKDDFQYQRVSIECEEDLQVTESTKQLKMRYQSLFQISGKEIQLGHAIGKGSYGEVYRADWRGILVAVKKLPAALLEDKKLLRDFYQEATIMSSLRHPNIVQYLGTCMLNGDICIISEYMGCGSVHRILHDESIDLTWEMIKKFALDTAQGMVYLHESIPKILHRDLKSQNLLCDETLKVKISDFGLSKVIENVNVSMTSCGTASWAAPEVLKNSRYTEKADVYSFGVCMWEFITRRDPYEGMPAFQVVFAVGTEGLRPTIPEGCPPDYASLVQDCWNIEPDNRPSFREVVARIKSLN